MGGDKQVQKAGDCSQQYQANNITIINGVTEERVRTIFHEQSLIARKEYTEDAYRIADERVGKFEEQFMSRITQVEKALPSFADPAFQFLLRDAQKTAATTDREADYDLLTELLVCHIEKGQDIKKRAGIKRAVEIVDEIDNDALCGLTVAHAFMTYSPTSNNCIEGIKVLNNLFEKIIYQKLPSGESWLDHLDVLGAIRLSSFGNMSKVSEYIPLSLDGYVCVGIKEDSKQYKKAVDLLAESRISSSVLVKNDCLEGYVRLPVRDKHQIEDLVFKIGETEIPLNQKQKDTFKQIWEMYSKDASLINQAKANFWGIWNHHEKLHRLQTWWDAIPKAFEITQVGKILAQTNAKRCNPTLPDLI